MKKTPIAAAILLTLTLPPAFAQTETTTAPVVVEGTRLTPPQEITVPLDQVPGIAADGGALLRSLPGVSGSRMGGRGIDPIIHGQSQTRLNVLLDGAYVHGGCPNRMDPPSSYSPIDTYDRVTVIKGAETVLYGGGGSGGTVLFERYTPRLTAEKHFRAKLGAGLTSNAHTKTAAADITAGGPQGFARGIVEYVDAGNYRDGDGNTTRTAFTSKSGDLILGYTPDNATRAVLNLESSRETDVLYAGAGMDSPLSTNHTVRFKFSRDRATGPFASVKAELYRANIDHVMDNYSLRTLTAPMKMRTDSSSDTWGGRASADLNSHGATWTIGTDLQHNARDAVRYTGMAMAPVPTKAQSLLWPDASLDQRGLFVQLSKPLNTRDTFSAGLRYDRVKAAAGKAASTTAGMSPNMLYKMYYGTAAETRNEDNVGGFMRFEHGFGNGLSAYAGVSRSVRTADATERFLAGANMTPSMRWVGNPLLAPEKHRELDLGMTVKRSAWDMHTSVYYDSVHDYILRDRAHGQAGILMSDNATIYRNVDAHLYGLDWRTTIHLTARWTGTATLSYVYAENTTDGRPIAQIPPLQGTVDLKYAAAHWRVGGTVRMAAKQTRVDDNPATGSGLDAGPTPGFAVLDLYGDVDLARHTVLKLGITNVFDKTYAYHVNQHNSDPFNPAPVQVNEPGREFWAKVQARF